MANEHVILCGSVSESNLPISDPRPLRLRMWGPYANVHFAFEDMLRGMYGDLPAPFPDLIDIAVYVYCADQAIPRGEPTDRNFGEDWRRRLCFRIPVREPGLWNQAQMKQLLVSALSFLTEDAYDFQFEPLREEQPIQNYFQFSDRAWRGHVQEVVLYSGGLDSLGGAVQEAVLDRRQVVLVQHRSSPKMVPRQRHLLGQLEGKAKEVPPALLPVRINKDKGLSRESTQRSRSFLYASLGAALARMLKLPRIRFYENGVVSLNLPPSAQVVGARASRTTHPQTLNRLSVLFSLLADQPFRVENPFRWRTKAQVVEHLVQAGCGDLIRRIGDGTIDVLEVKHGLPFRTLVTETTT